MHTYMHVRTQENNAGVHDDEESLLIQGLNDATEITEVKCTGKEVN
jgi:hypothetical protein